MLPPTEFVGPFLRLPRPFPIFQFAVPGSEPPKGFALLPLPSFRQEQPNKRNRKVEKEVEALNNMSHFPSNVHKVAGIPIPLLWPRPSAVHPIFL